MTSILPLSLLAILALAAAAVPLARRFGREAGYPLGAGFAAITVWLAAQAPTVLGGDALVFSAPWVPALGIRFSLSLDGLSLLFATLILGVGAIVLIYTARYLPPGRAHGRLYGLIVLFAASMLGLVYAQDAMLLFVFWELTTVTSFFLIGGGAGPQASRAAIRALLVTALGGLALFGALVGLIVVTGTSDLGTILGEGDAIRAHALGLPILALILVGAFTKSAQVPFHFWLPGAMIAPTPVSTYLHAATMVKAGIYLLARFTPVFGGSAPWVYTIVITGLVTSLTGAVLALKQHDLKALLAYSTVSQLGFIVALVGVGTPRAIGAATIHTVAHATYKATLFMVAGIIDVEAGSRDIRRLSGLRRMMPLTAAVTGVAALSMAGFPPFLGFVSKEEAFASFLAAPGAPWLGPLAGGLAVAASVITFGYGARIVDGAFGGPASQHLHEPRRSFLAPAALAAVAGLALGVVVGALDPLAAAVARATTGVEADLHLGLWHGLDLTLALSAVTIAGGVTLFALRRPIDRLGDAVRLPLDGTDVFDRAHDGIVRLGELAGRPFVKRVPARHLAWVLAAAVVPVTWAWFHYQGEPISPPPTRPEDWAVVALLALAVAAAATARVRLAAVAVVGVAGFIVALVYVLLGGADLAITQVLVETLTIVVVVLVFRRLPAAFRRVATARRVAAAAAAIAVGGAAAFGTYVLTGRREPSDVAAYYLEAAPTEAGGANVVNTILVDFRALDTLGEIVVLAVAGLGVFALTRSGRAQR